MCIAAAIGGAAVVGGAVSARGASKAAKAQQASADQSAATQERIATADREQQAAQYTQAREDLRPFRELGYRGVNELSRAATGDMSGFYASPDYNFRRTEGERDIGSSFAARGGAFSGNALKALSEFNSNLARGEYGDWWNRTAGTVNVGQGGTAQTVAAGTNAANAISGINQNLSTGLANSITNAGNARASGIQGQYNALGDAVGFAGGVYAGYGGIKRPQNALSRASAYGY
jgi:hypothetical protein